MSRRCPRCSIFISRSVKREVEGGDAFFPPFEDKFQLAATLRDEPEFKDSALPAQIARKIKW